MRALGLVAGLAATVLAGGVLTGGAVADEPPSRHDVHEARAAVRDQAGDVASVRARLVVANQRLQETAMRAAQAAEAYNGARWRAAQASQEAADARRRARIAAGDVERQRRAYGDALVSSYELAPGLTAFSAIVGSDGIDEVVQQTTTLQNAESALDANYDGCGAAAPRAAGAALLPADAEVDAGRTAAAAREARGAARAGSCCCG